MKFVTTTVKGFGRGKTLGFPTINMQITEGVKKGLQEGIYASLVFIEGKTYKGALYFGTVPVFYHNEQVLEVFLIDERDFEIKENTTIEVEVKDFLRGVMSFNTSSELADKMQEDVQKIRTLL